MPAADLRALVAPRASANARFWGHPSGLWMLLGVTVGLNIGFYGFRAYLTPYIAQTFFAGLGEAAAQKQADLLGSGFFALMYATPILGGYVADKILGESRAVAISLWLCVLSLLLMAQTSLAGFESGLALFALATGLGIPLTVLIGRNYAGDDPRREGGYLLYYMAINVGSMVAPPLCAGLIGSHFGDRWGFVGAAGGMLLAAALFQWRKRRLDPMVPARGHIGGGKSIAAVLVVIALLLYPVVQLLSLPRVLRWAMYLLMAALVLYFAVQCMHRRDRVQTHRYLALLLLFLALVVFWALSLQGVTSLNFFARDHVLAPFRYTLFQSANPLFILIFAPLMALLWPWLGRHEKDPSTPTKFGIGLLLVALGYGLLAWAIGHWQLASGYLPWWPLALCYLLLTLGELALSPIGYALVGQLAAPQDSSLAMGGWFFGVALAYQLGGWIATQTAGSGAAASRMGAYAHVYGLLFWYGLGVAGVFLLAAPGIRRLMHGIR